MADKKISELDALTGANTADDDVLVIVDTSAGLTKKITLGELENALAERDFNFGDNDKLTFGAGSDLQIFHLSANNASYIQEQNATGSLYIEGHDVYIRSYSEGDNMIIAERDGAVTLHYDNAAKLATTATGVDITGTLTSDGLTVDGNPVVSGSSPQIFLQTGASHYNWQLAAQENISGAFEIGSGEVDADATDDTYTTRFVIESDGDFRFGGVSNYAWMRPYESSTGNLIISADNGGTGTNGSAIKFRTRGADKMVIEHSGNVGIGTSSPTRTLSVNGTAGFGNGTIETLISFSDRGIFGTQSNHDLELRTNGSEAMRIDSSGNLLVGHTAEGTWSSNNSAILRGSGVATFTSTSTPPLYANRLTTDGDIVQFRKDGSTVGSIGTGSTANFQIYNAQSSHVGLEFGSPNIMPTNNSGVLTDAGAALGSSSYRFSDLYLSGEITGPSQLTRDVNTGSLALAGGTDSNVGANILLYGGSHASLPNITRFRVGSSERMRIDSSGNLLVGTTAYTGNTTNSGGGIRNDGLVFGSVNGGSAAVFNRISTNGDIALFRKDGSTVGSIGTTGGYMYAGSGNTYLYYDDTNNIVRPSNSAGAARDNIVGLGNASNRFTNLYLSGGVYLGGTDAEHLLHDYEEGAFTLTVVTGTVGSVTARYTKVGQLVTVRGHLYNFSDRTSGNTVEISNLPFTAKSNSGANGAVFGRQCGLSLTSTYVIGSSTRAQFYNTNPTGNYEALTHSDLSDSTAAIYFKVVYETSS